MRIVTKVNLALAGVVAISAALNFVVLATTVLPSFQALETEAAERNQSRALEAIKLQQAQVANSARDYAFWDDSYEFVHGNRTDYEAKNVSAESLAALGVNYFLAIDESGAIKLDKGFDFSGDEPATVQLFSTDALADAHPLRRPFPEIDARSGLMKTAQGLVAVGYAPITTSDRGAAPSGVLLFGRLIDVEALRQATEVNFMVEPFEKASPPVEGMVQSADVIRTHTVLTGIDGAPLAVVTSTTKRLISAAGQRAIYTAMGLLALGGVLLIGTLAFALRRIAVKRLAALRNHIVRIASTGSLETIPEDGRGDELSETISSFNLMAAQLAELRDKLRRQDYRHGAADQAAGILHNVRNAVSPLSAVTWDLARGDDVPWKQNLAKALVQLEDPALAPERAEKLRQFLALSTQKFLDEGEKRKADLQMLAAMVRHVDEILKGEDLASRGERVREQINLAASLAEVSKMIARRPGIALIADLPPDSLVLGHRIAFEQVLGNLLLNAAEAIEASGRSCGTISISLTPTQHSSSPAFNLAISDDGDGIATDCLERIFEKGYSTRRERSGGLGLHWSANAVNAMNGRIFAESAGKGHGATVHVVLPAAVDQLREAA
ncbi:CHASE4 domain-containing protein [Aurantimonas sp. 22II-16-19i]|uniref:sensor histidine kinase n=1 Tax=Aurantimonas sp. 22II-16-19i TaxID=1317114 RepID=UPI0009F7B90C|nr:CHASE4 domain-containing protein [Aurantimonas sp. 22II-16-19i]ORE90740.1 integral membrane sensor signal transduction histidine kinase [Aurantimonas sp. 22II-16-19i]